MPGSEVGRIGSGVDAVYLSHWHARAGGSSERLRISCRRGVVEKHREIVLLGHRTSLMVLRKPRAIFVILPFSHLST